MDNTDPYKTKFKEERLYMSTNQNLMQHMRELIDRIKAADVAYYRDDNPTMTDREYDLLVDELKELETTTGLILSGSPTQTVSGEILKELTPVRHTKPMLSADKTKSVDEMLRFANGRPVVLSWKLDGLTLVLRYEGGEFKQAITRGREGIIGEDVTHTVRTFMNVPMCIPCADKFEVRGEGVISWAHFEKLNLSLSEPYSHPRNLAAGSVRMLDARESGKRYLEFFAFDLISDSIEEHSKAAQLQFLAENGFDVVPYCDIPERPEFVFWHPPYWDIIQYFDVMYKASDVMQKYGYDPKRLDLSRIENWNDFVKAMNYAMMKQFSALEKGGRMAVLMGDIKKKGRFYSMLAEIVKPGTLENIIIKAQHNCFSDRTQYSGKFIPILHEYVMIVRKDSPVLIPILITQSSAVDIRDMPGATWRDVVAAVLEQCKEPVALSFLYEQIEPHKKAQANKWWKEKIRQTLQINPMHFTHDGRGLWSLNRNAA